MEYSDGHEGFNVVEKEMHDNVEVRSPKNDGSHGEVESQETSQVGSTRGAGGVFMFHAGYDPLGSGGSRQAQGLVTPSKLVGLDFFKDGPVSSCNGLRVSKKRGDKSNPLPDLNLRADDPFDIDRMGR
ncbi:hypothetical protein Hanom_Chr09g00859611 [Helianthus anomalus]